MMDMLERGRNGSQTAGKLNIRNGIEEKNDIENRKKIKSQTNTSTYQ